MSFSSSGMSLTLSFNSSYARFILLLPFQSSNAVSCSPSSVGNIYSCFSAAVVFSSRRRSFLISPRLTLKSFPSLLLPARPLFSPRSFLLLILVSVFHVDDIPSLSLDSGHPGVRERKLTGLECPCGHRLGRTEPLLGGDVPFCLPSCHSAA